MDKVEREREREREMERDETQIDESLLPLLMRTSPLSLSSARSDPTRPFVAGEELSASSSSSHSPSFSSSFVGVCACVMCACVDIPSTSSSSFSYRSFNNDAPSLF